MFSLPLSIIVGLLPVRQPFSQKANHDVGSQAKILIPPIGIVVRNLTVRKAHGGRKSFPNSKKEWLDQKSRFFNLV